MSQSQASLARNRWFRYGVAIAAVALAVLLRWLLVGACGEMPPFITFVPAICLIAMIVGGGPAAIMTVLSVVAVFTVMPAAGRLHTGRSADLIAAAIALVTGGMLSLMATLLERSRRQLLATAERRGAEREQEVASEFLAMVNASTGTRQLVEAAVRFCREQSGCEAVGIRLKEGDDYPYYEAHGFPERFVQLENSLCVRDADGNVQRDRAGNPAMACMCGSVICGRFDASKPFFTPAGSFWTNDTTRLLATTTDADRQTGTRNRCNGMGYESVALIALRVGEERLGLLQLNDRRKNRFTPETIALWERLGGYLAVALAKARADETVRESEVKFSTAFAASPDAMIISRADDGLIREINEGGERLLGLARHELLGKRSTDLGIDLDPADRERGIAILRKEGRLRDYELLIRRPSGEIRRTLLSVEPIEIAGEDLILSVISDITEQKQAEEALRESEERLRRLGDNIPETAVYQYTHGPDGRGVFLYVSAGIERLNGVTVEEVLRDGGALHRQIPPEYLDALVRAEARSAREMRDFDMDVPMRRPDGEVRWMRLHSRPRQMPDGRIVWDGVQIDITERQGAEEALRESERFIKSVAEASPHCFYVFDFDRMGITYANRPIVGDLGYPPDVVIATTGLDAFRAFMPPEELPHLGRVMEEWQTLPDGRVRDDEYRLRHADGALRYFAGREIVFARRSDGTVQRVLGLLFDITRRKRAEENLQAAQMSAEQAKAIAESANRSKDQFIAVLSHELRTPLTPAVAALSLLRSDRRLPSDVREDLEMVTRNIDLEVRLIADLLDVSRAISGKMHLDRRPVDVAEAIREAAKIVSGDLDAKGQTLTVETPGAPYLAFADVARLQQVFWNLLRNAVKFSPDRSRIAVRAHVEPVEHCPLAASPCPVGMGECPLPHAGNGDGEACGGNLVVEVIDQGSGIAPDVLPRVFNAFEQELKARPFGGLGLGLSICKAVVELHGGSISARSDGVGRGATFTVRLPVAQCPLSKAREQSSPQGAEPTAAPALQAREGGLRILLVEDHADTAKLMRRLLMGAGHEVSTAGSVADALAAVRRQDPDVLISDLGLPDGSGLDLMRQLVEEGHPIPAIALSGYGGPADIEASRAAGFAEHLVKPLGSVDVLTSAIARLGGRGGREMAKASEPSGPEA